MPETTESSDEEWEEVEESQNHQEEEEDVKPSESVEVELDLPAAIKKKRKKEEWEREMVETSIRRAAKRFDKELQLAMHKVHVLCLLALGMKINTICNKDELKALAYSLLPQKYTDNKPKHISAIFLTRFIQDFGNVFEYDEGIEKLKNCKHARLPNLERLLTKVLEKQKVQFRLDLVLVFVLALRAMGFNTRLVLSMQPIQLKPMTAKQKENAAESESNTAAKKKASPKKRKAEPNSIPQVDGANDSPRPRTTRSRLKKDHTPTNKDSVKVVKSAKKRKQQITKSDVENEAPKKGEKKRSRKGGKKVEQRPKVVPKKKNSKKVGQVARCPKVVLERNKVIESLKRENTDKDVEQSVDETPLPKPLIESRAKRKIAPKAKVKRRVADATSDSDRDEDFAPVKSSDSEDSDFEVEIKKNPPKRRKSNVATSKSASSRKIISKKTDTKAVSSKRSSGRTKPANNRDCYDQWLEVYSEQEGRWICLDIFQCVVNHPERTEKYSSPPLHYVLGFENGGYIKDITARYASKWLTETRKLRVGIADKDWWKETLGPYATPDTAMDVAENRGMQERLLAQPMPTSIAAYKNHPLFGLRRHLLKYEAIYSLDIPAVGLIRGEEVFPRSSIHTLHTRDKWLQEARVVKDGEEPYKMVASLWINMKLKQDMATLSMPLFGIWQTEPFVPPVAKDGKVPRNQYGNVDLFQPSMMPIGCVQLRLQGLNRVARKLDIDIASAITGFDSHSGYPHPVTDGFIVCKEHEETLVAAWREDQIHAAEREKKKREERVYERWKLFIKAMLAKERVAKKYGSKDKASVDKSNNTNGTAVSSESATAWQAKRLEAAKKKSRGRGSRAKKEENMFPFETESM